MHSPCIDCLSQSTFPRFFSQHRLIRPRSALESHWALCNFTTLCAAGQQTFESLVKGNHGSGHCLGSVCGVAVGDRVRVHRKSRVTERCPLSPEPKFHASLFRLALASYLSTFAHAIRENKKGTAYDFIVASTWSAPRHRPPASPWPLLKASTTNAAPHAWSPIQIARWKSK